MTDHELLSAISDMLDKKLDEKLDDKLDKKLDEKLDRKLNARLGSIENRLAKLDTIESGFARLDTIESELTRLNPIESRLKRIEVDLLENNVIPRLNTIEVCYTSTYNRYKDSVDDYEAMKQDVSVMKKVILEHSKMLQT